MSLKYFIIVLRRYTLDIALAAALAALVVFMSAMIYFSMTSPEAIAIDKQQREWFKKIEQEYNTPAGERAWKRLHRKHGNPGVVIYEMGKEPWYVDAKGRKCRFI